MMARMLMIMLLMVIAGDYYDQAGREILSRCFSKLLCITIIYDGGQSLMVFMTYPIYVLDLSV